MRHALTVLPEVKPRVTSLLLLLLVSVCPLQADTASTPRVQDTLSRHQHHRGVDGLIGAMGSYVSDLGMHTLHLLLSGPDVLMLNELDFTGAAGRSGSEGELCGASGSEAGGVEGKLCGERSSKVYCMKVAAADFREADIRRHTLGSTCAPGGMRSVHDTLYSDFCTRRFPATQSVYFSEERCSLLPGVQCSSG